jgi:hypothetical protein
MKYLLLLVPVFLTGCLKTAPVKMDFPDVPPDLKTACPDLALVKDGAKMSEVIEVVSGNYAQYHECRNKIDTWIEWHKQQKKIYEDVK